MSEAIREEMAGTNPSQNETFEEVFRRRLGQRSLLKGAMASVPLLTFGSALLTPPSPVEAAGGSTPTFEPIPLSTEDAVIVPPGYATQGANVDLLDAATLYVAKFNDEGWF